MVDVFVVGAGPAGMAAAVRLRAHGLSVTLADEQPAPGGQIWRGVERNTGTRLETALGPDYAKGAALVDAFRQSGTEYLPSSQVWQVEDGWNVLLTRDGMVEHRMARSLLLATGAQERPVPFPGWTLPGVMTVGAAQILLKSGGYLPQGPVWLCGSGPLPLLYARQILALGGRLDGFLDTAPRAVRTATLRRLPGALGDWRSLVKGVRWLRELRRSGLRIVRHAQEIAAEGGDRLERVRWMHAGRTESSPAGLLLVHEGIVPSVHPTLALGCAHDWSVAQGCLAPRLDPWGETSRAGLFVAGDGAGIGGADAAVVRGEIAAEGIARRLGKGTGAATQPPAGLARRRARALAARPFLDALYPPPRRRLPDDLVVCRCEEVTAGAIREAARAGAPDPNQVKAATRAGMGPCQGRQCGYTVSHLVAEAHGLHPEEVAFFNIRPPLKPVTLGQLAAFRMPEDVE